MNELRKEFTVNEIYDENSIYGLWYKPHEAIYVCVIFHKNNTFEMWDYDVHQGGAIENVYRAGTFTMKGDSVVMQPKNHRLALRMWKACANGRFQHYYDIDPDNGWAKLDYQEQRTYLTEEGENKKYYLLVK